MTGLQYTVDRITYKAKDVQSVGEKCLTQAHVAQLRTMCVDFDDLFTFPHVKCTYPPIYNFFIKNPGICF